jgi:effector-binding domain-containing protein
MTTYDVHVSQQRSVPVAVVRRVARPAEFSRLVPEYCGVVWEFVRARQLKAGRNVAIYWDSSVRLEVGVELDGEFPESDTVVRSATPAGLVASVVHFGPYQQLGAAHDAVHRWSAQHGNRLAGPRWEVYGHWQRDWNGDPSKIRTDVCYLLESAASTAGSAAPGAGADPAA